MASLLIGRVTFGIDFDFAGPWLVHLEKGDPCVCKFSSSFQQENSMKSFSLRTQDPGRPMSNNYCQVYLLRVYDFSILQVL